MGIINGSTNQGESAWNMETYSGDRIVNLQTMWIGDISLEDIAHALSMTCRFNGHCKVFYSVAQHSCLLSRRLVDTHKASTEAIRWGLMHDAAEAYLGDIIRPFKREMTEIFNPIETRLNNLIQERFKIYPTKSDLDLVEMADNKMLWTEKRDIMGNAVWGIPFIKPYENKIVSWNPGNAKEMFLQLAERLGIK